MVIVVAVCLLLSPIHQLLFLGDTTEQAGTGSDSDFKMLGDDERAADREVAALSLQPVEKDTDDEIPVDYPLFPSPPVDAGQMSISLVPADLPADSNLKAENALQASSSDMSDDCVTCDDQQSAADVSSSFLRRAKRHLSAASKYRLRCQCGAKNCRQYLY